MKISFENPDKVNGLITLTVEEADYKENVEKTIETFGKVGKEGMKETDIEILHLMIE